jgi:hypothetical protein
VRREPIKGGERGNGEGDEILLYLKYLATLVKDPFGGLLL